MSVPLCRAVTRKGIAVLEGGGSYDKALAAIRPDTRDWWDDILSDDLQTHPGDKPIEGESYVPSRPDAASLLRFLKTRRAADYREDPFAGCAAAGDPVAGTRREHGSISCRPHLCLGRAADAAVRQDARDADQAAGDDGAGTGDVSASCLPSLIGGRFTPLKTTSQRESVEAQNKRGASTRRPRA